MRTRSEAHWPSWRTRWPLGWFFRHAYFSRLRWTVRILAWVVTAGFGSLAGWQYAVLAEARRQAALPRVPSPGGWTVPADVRPAWNWTPPPGVEPRLDRVPMWARAWYGTPLVDRYAHAWLWYHGGWDVVPPDAWTLGLPPDQ